MTERSSKEEHDRRITEDIARSGLSRAPEWFERAYEDVLFRLHGLISAGGKHAAADLWDAIEKHNDTEETA